MRQASQLHVSETTFANAQTGEQVYQTFMTPQQLARAVQNENGKSRRLFCMTFFDGTAKLLSHPDLNDADRTVFMALVQHMDELNFLHFNREQIAEETIRTPNSITRAIKNLRAAGVIHAWTRLGNGYSYRVDPLYVTRANAQKQAQIAREIHEHYQKQGGKS